MKRTIVAAIMTMVLSSVGCDGSGGTGAGSRDTSLAVPVPAVVTDGPARAEPAPIKPVVVGAPIFAVMYPSAIIEGEPTLADGVAGPGGLVTFTTSDAPQAVVDFYKIRAEASGLSPIMAMNQGEAIAYGAGSPGGATIQVVASPTTDRGTSVQLSWSAGE